MEWIYLSPHFDDVALSCGGLVWEQVQAGEQVSIWTVCAGEPTQAGLSPFAQQLHARWDTGLKATDQRRGEDQNSCHRLGASPYYLNIPDCIYRRDPHTTEYLYASERALNGPVQPGDELTLTTLGEELRKSITPQKMIICPLALGNHVDHQLTRQAVEKLGLPGWYYEDYPYVLQNFNQLHVLEQNGWGSQIFHVSMAGLAAWQDSIAAHHSQISTFWTDQNEMRRAVADFLAANNGIRLWTKTSQ